MTHSKSKLSTKEIAAFRKFLEGRGFKCRDGKGDWQLFQVKNLVDNGWKAFCFNAKGVVTSPAEFDALIQVFHSPVDPAPAVEVIDRASHDSDLLDDFAIAALNGMLSGNNVSIKNESSLAEDSYKIAKAMMAERAKHQQK